MKNSMANSITNYSNDQTPARRRNTMMIAYRLAIDRSREGRRSRRPGHDPTMPREDWMLAIPSAIAGSIEDSLAAAPHRHQHVHALRCRALFWQEQQSFRRRLFHANDPRFKMRKRRD